MECECGCGQEVNKGKRFVKLHHRIVKRPEPYIVGDIGYVPLTKGKVSIIDAEDLPKIAGRRWHAHWDYHVKSYYARCTGKREASGRLERLRIHRIVMDCPPDKIVDHINHDTLDNRKQNLRICDNSTNMRNKKPKVAQEV